LTWDVLKPRVQQALAKPLGDWTSCYGPMAGGPQLTETVAKFMSSKILKCDVSPSNIVCMTGVAAILNALFAALCDEGDEVLVPAPFYAAFIPDLGNLAGVRCIPCDLSNLEKSFTKGRTSAILLTNPHNPLGTVLSRSQLEEISDFCQRKNIHLVSDEIYALSHFRKNSSNVDDFVSLAQIRRDRKQKSDECWMNEHHHVIWGLSKDFGMSGLRFGCLYSRNSTVLEATRSLANFCCVPGVCQQLVADLLNDTEFCDTFLKINAARLRASCELVEARLHALHIPFVMPTAGMFIWFDLSQLLLSTTFSSDIDIYNALIAEQSIVLTPGSSQHGPPGTAWFRICYAYVQPDILTVALDRLTAFIKMHRG